MKFIAYLSIMVGTGAFWAFLGLSILGWWVPDIAIFILLMVCVAVFCEVDRYVEDPKGVLA